MERAQGISKYFNGFYLIFHYIYNILERSILSKNYADNLKQLKNIPNNGVG